MKQSFLRFFVISTSAVAMAHFASEQILHFGISPAWALFCEILLSATVVAIPFWFWIYKPGIESSKRRGQLFEQAERELGMVVTVDPSGIFKDMSDSFCKFYGYTRDELIGKHHSILNSGSHPPEFFTDLWKTVLGRKVWKGEICNQAKDGSLSWVKTVIIPLLDQDNNIAEIFSIRHDVTGEREALEEVRRTHQKLEFSLQRLKFSIIEYDLKSRILICDDVTFELFGVPKSQYIGHHEIFQRCIQTHDLILLSESLKDAIEKQTSFSCEFSIRRASDGEKRLIRAEVDISENDSQEPVRILGIIKDITEAKDQELKILHSSKMSSLGEMASGIAHEINNPLTIILGKVFLLEQMVEKQNVDFPALSVASASIRKTAERIAKIIKGLRSFARDDSHDPMTIQKVDTIVNDTLELCKSRFISAGIKFSKLEIDPTLDLECRPIQISQVLLNLIGNSIDAVSKLPEKWIRLEVFETAGSIVFQLTDSGKGIPRHLRDKILQPFFTTKEVGKGTGLGLSISAGIAKSHKGELSIDETCPNTRFLLKIPRNQNLESPAFEIRRSAS